MTILVCRVAWMPGYQCDDEQAYGGGSYVKEGNVPHEALNFLPVDDTYYGFVENLRQQIRLERLGGQIGDPEINGVSVVFCATDRKTNDFLVTGWYAAATVYREPINRPGGTLGRRVHFTATNAVLIGESDRCFQIPRARERPQSPFGGIGQRNIWYGLNDERATGFCKSLNDYMQSMASMQTPEKTVVESRKRRHGGPSSRQPGGDPGGAGSPGGGGAFYHCFHWAQLQQVPRQDRLGLGQAARLRHDLVEIGQVIQGNLFSGFGPAGSKVDKALDAVREKFGDDAIVKGRSFGIKLNRQGPSKVE